jgi:hypothetical protein
MVAIQVLQTALRDAVLSSLELAAPKLRKIKHIDMEINGVSLDIYPWHEYFALSFRDSGNTVRYNSADWKYYELVSSQENKAPPIKKAAELITRSYTEAEDNGLQLTEAAHLIFLAGAEVLLNRAVATKIRASGLEAPIIGTGFPQDRCFEYMVFDVDRTIAANYCEIVIANRVTDRILAKNG